MTRPLGVNDRVTCTPTSTFGTWSLESMTLWPSLRRSLSRRNAHTWLEEIFSTTSGTAPTWWSRPQRRSGLDSGGQLDLVLRTERRRYTAWHREGSRPAGPLQARERTRSQPPSTGVDSAGERALGAYVYHLRPCHRSRWTAGNSSARWDRLTTRGCVRPSGTSTGEGGRDAGAH